MNYPAKLLQNICIRWMISEILTWINTWKKDFLGSPTGVDPMTFQISVGQIASNRCLEGQGFPLGNSKNFNLSIRFENASSLRLFHLHKNIITILLICVMCLGHLCFSKLYQSILNKFLYWHSAVQEFYRLQMQPPQKLCSLFWTRISTMKWKKDNEKKNAVRFHVIPTSYFLQIDHFNLEHSLSCHCASFHAPLWNPVLIPPQFWVLIPVGWWVAQLMYSDRSLPSDHFQTPSTCSSVSPIQKSRPTAR